MQPGEALVEKAFPANGDQRLHVLIAPQQRGEIRAARSQKRDETGGTQTWKLSPQPQRPFSFGLVKVKPEASAFTS